jgi:hypothetical protein
MVAGCIVSGPVVRQNIMAKGSSGAERPNLMAARKQRE